MSDKLKFIVICLVCFSSLLLAQEPEIDQLLERQREYSDISDLLEMLAELEKNPIDLNHATAEQLAVLPWISNVLAFSITSYREQYGSFKAVEELTQVENVSPDLILILQQYLTVSSSKMGRQFSVSAKTRFIRKIEKPGNFENSASYFSATKIYNRVNINYGKIIRAGLLLEKDSGEHRIDDLRLYFLSYRGNSNKDRLIIGNYRLEFARGLIFSSPYGYYKGSDPIFPARRRERELLEYTIVDENASLYGVAGQFCFKIYQFFLFISDTQRDATLNDDGTVKNFYTSGYHRNAVEMSKKDRLNEQLIGGRVLIKPAPNFSLGTTYYRSIFNRVAAIQDENLHRFSFEGKINELIGIDYNLILGQFNLFGEIARSKNKGFGLLSGVLMESQYLDFIVLGRKYSKDFISFYGNSFSESSDNPQNEQGIYTGFQIKPIKNLKIRVYFDQFKFPWRTYRIPMPSNGKDILFRIEHKIIKNLLLSVQYKFEQKESYNSLFKQVIPRDKKNLRLQLDFQPSSILRLRCRVEKNWIDYHYNSQLDSRYPYNFQGILLYQDASLKVRPNLDVAARLTFFDTDNYESRLYQFEHDIPGMLTNQMLNGIGTRSYIRIQWSITNFLNLSLKYGSTQSYPSFPVERRSYSDPGKRIHYIHGQLETNW